MAYRGWRMNNFQGPVDTVHSGPAVLPNGQEPGRAPAELSRLIMVATSAWELPDRTEPSTGEDFPSGYPALLSELLSTPYPGRAWLGRDRGNVEYLPHGSAESNELFRTLVDEVETTCESVRRRIDRSRAARRQELAALRHRIVVDPARLRAMTDTGPVKTAEDRYVHLIALDFRFEFHLDTPLCHLSLSVWSARPWHQRHVPGDWPDREPRKDNIEVEEISSYTKAFHDILRRTIAVVQRHLVETDHWVYLYRNVLPIFWVPVPARQERDAAEYPRRQPELRRALAKAFLGLGDPADCVGTTSVVNGQFDVLRRFIPGLRLAEPRPEDHRVLSRAHYVILPGRPPGARDGMSLEERRRSFGTQEDQTADLVTKLTDLEARRARNMREIHQDLLIWHNHLGVYDQVAEHGTFLWDGLSAHLVTRRRVLRRVHHAVELLHQILLQGVGDIAQLTNRTRDCLARIREAGDQLRTEYDEALTERHEHQPHGLRGALDRTGLFERVTQHGEQTLEDANRVKTLYDDLLRTIGYAFDEWRVRESDVVQRLSAALGTVLGLLGVVTVLDATVDLKPDPAKGTVTVLGGDKVLQADAVKLSWGLGVVVLLAVAWLGYNWLRSGRLGSRNFGHHYSGRRFFDRRNGLWRLLKDISTDGLEKSIAERGADARTFAERDRNLAERFAKFWDEASAMHGTDRENGLRRDIRAQKRRIEQWGLHTLLLTERARRMHIFNLPLLTCLYRCCTRIPGSSLGGPNRPGTNTTFGRSATAPTPQDIRTMIDFNEFALSFRHIGLTRMEAHRLEHWLLHRQPHTARHLLAILTNIGLSADMSREQIDVMFTRIRKDLDAADLSTYPDAFHEDATSHLARAGFTGHVLITAHSETAKTLASLCRTRLRHPRRTLRLATTGSLGRPARVVATAFGIRTTSLNWAAVAPDRPAGEAAHSRRR
jgi:hypothetical protein